MNILLHDVQRRESRVRFVIALVAIFALPLTAHAAVQGPAPTGRVVEIKHVDPDDSMVRAIAQQAEAERARRAKVIHAAGELEASHKLREAAGVLAQRLEAMQLRYLQTLTQIAGGKSTTIVFPLPLDWLAAVAGGAGTRAPKPA